MKRTYISPELLHTRTNGTFNMIEQKALFGSKMMEIEDEIFFDTRDVVYYQQNNGEQINFTQEQLYPPVIYSILDDKIENHVLELFPGQGEADLNSNTRWLLTINVRNILINYIFSQIKNARAFEGVLSNLTKDEDINLAILSYIDSNILDRYSFGGLTLYLTYNDLGSDGTLQESGNTLEDFNVNKVPDRDPVIKQGPNGLELEDVLPESGDLAGNIWDSSINQPGNIEKKVGTQFNSDKSILRANFRQSKPRNNYSFNYYFEFKFIKS